MAMSTAQVEQGFSNAKSWFYSLNNKAVIHWQWGSMGIGNTTSAAAIMAAILNLPVTQCVGRGTGVSDELIARKINVVEQALQLHKAHLADPIALLAAVGGFEIVHITGAMLAAAEKVWPLLLMALFVVLRLWLRLKLTL